MNNEEIAYERNQLQAVILKIDFGMESTIEPGAELISKFRSKFPKYHTIEEQLKQANFQTNSITAQQNSKHHFSKIDNSAVATISGLQKAFFLETSSYKTWNKFKENITELLSAIESQYSDKSITRVGLRYINNITAATPAEFKQNISSEMYKAFSSVISTVGVSRQFVIREYTFEDHMLKFQYGLANEFYPSPLSNYNFALDIDAFTNIPIEFSEIIDTLENFHKEIQEIFESSISEKLRSKFGKIVKV